MKKYTTRDLIDAVLDCSDERLKSRLSGLDSGFDHPNVITLFERAATIAEYLKDNGHFLESESRSDNGFIRFLQDMSEHNDKPETGVEDQRHEKFQIFAVRGVHNGKPFYLYDDRNHYSAKLPKLQRRKVTGSPSTGVYSAALFDERQDAENALDVIPYGIAKQMEVIELTLPTPPPSTPTDFVPGVATNTE